MPEEKQEEIQQKQRSDKPLIVISAVQADYCIALFHQEDKKSKEVEVASIAVGPISIASIRRSLEEVMLQNPDPIVFIDLPDRAAMEIGPITDKLTKALPPDLDPRSLVFDIVGAINDKAISCPDGFIDRLLFELSGMDENGNFRSSAVRAVAIGVGILRRGNRECWAGFGVDGDLSEEKEGPRTIEQLLLGNF